MRAKEVATALRLPSVWRERTTAAAFSPSAFCISLQQLADLLQLLEVLERVERHARLGDRRALEDRLLRPLGDRLAAQVDRGQRGERLLLGVGALELVLELRHLGARGRTRRCPASRTRARRAGGARRRVSSPWIRLACAWRLREREPLAERHVGRALLDALPLALGVLVGGLPLPASSASGGTCPDSTWATSPASAALPAESCTPIRIAPRSPAVGGRSSPSCSCSSSSSPVRSFIRREYPSGGAPCHPALGQPFGYSAPPAGIWKTRPR